MRFRLTLHTDQRNATIPVNYQYPLSAVIYKIISRADAHYATFLHEHGYRADHSLKRFRLFTFSDLHSPFHIHKDRLILNGSQASFLICFHLPEAAEIFIRGLFLQQTIEIADRASRVAFRIAQVESLPVVIDKEEAALRPVSPVVCGLKNERGHYDFLTPEDKDFSKMLLLNWQEKIKSVYEVSEEDLKQLRIEPVFYKNRSKSRLITIKADSPAETKIRGFMNFKIEISAKIPFIELLMNSGLGLYNAMGMGCVEPG